MNFTTTPFRREHTLLLLLLLLSSRLDAQDQSKPKSSPPDRADEANAAARMEVKKFAFHFAHDRGVKLSMQEEPVFRATNPLRGEVYSNWYVWTHQGRPEVIASVSKWYSPRLYVGLAATSLSPEMLIGTREEQEIWRPRQVGVQLRPIPDATPPADSAGRRLLQMRALAREFTAEFKRVASVPEGGKLRLLSQPFYRYESTRPGLVDGAVFAFAHGTAPQLILLIEARQEATDFHWEYGLAPMNSTEFHVWHKDREVWSLAQVAPPWRNSQDPTNSYTVFPDLTDEGRTQVLADRLSKATHLSTDGKQSVDD